MSSQNEFFMIPQNWGECAAQENAEEKMEQQQQVKD